jgi:hypothetical protein
VSERQQQRVTFRFGTAAEVRYLRALPEVGDFVTHRNALWVVTTVDVDSLGGLVICENTATRHGQPTRASEA